MISPKNSRPLLLLQFILLFSTFLIPSALHLRVCPPAMEFGSAAISGHCHEQQHAAEAAGVLADGCGDCHQQPIGCGRAHNYPGLHKGGSEKLRTKVIVPLHCSILSPTPGFRLAPNYSAKSYCPPYSWPAAGQVLELRSTVMRC